jgi:hypothetical protein
MTLELDLDTRQLAYRNFLRRALEHHAKRMSGHLHNH